MKSSPRSNDWVTGFIFVFLALQILVPAYLLHAARPARWGWQMYSSYAQLPQIVLQLSDGTVQSVDLTEYVVNARYEILKAQTLLPHFCALADHVIAVQYRAGDEIEVQQCP
ncbi:MAG: hypothetical protein KDE19_09180 [Caldilineaceae bacterium]|nr:hypothetical protein [Caldilineaceae bacterium]